MTRASHTVTTVTEPSIQLCDAPAHATMANLLTLPVELRQQIYNLVLPYTTTIPTSTVRLPWTASVGEYDTALMRTLRDDTDAGKIYRMGTPVGSNILWHRGCTAILGVCRRIHEEAADMLYGENMFVLVVTFNAITFQYRWQTHDGVMSSRGYSFLEHFSQRNVLRVRMYVVYVELVDDYTAFIQYKFRRPEELPARMRAKVGELVQQLAAAPWLQCVQVNLLRSKQKETVLEAFRVLSGVREAEVIGVSKAYAEELSKSMTAQRGT
jgi:hypothetical protein